MTDPFDTAALRARVLDAWAASPSRFREDANAEEDYALGGYRDRVIVELAQNAADAAVRAGVPGRLRLTLRDGILTAANTGAPLEAAGVEALSTLRASSKRDTDSPETVGRFGVGFAAVVAVSDAPRIRSVTGLVGWSRERSRELVAAIPALAGELAARSGQVPVLRLPFGDDDGLPDGALPDGSASTVELPLRDAAAEELVGRLLAQVGPALLLALPALSEVIIEVPGGTRVLSAVHHGGRSTITDNGTPSEWLVAGAAGELDPALLADRPVEERARTSWTVRWAVPVTDDGTPAGRLPGGVSPVVHGPTPTDEPLSLPALLLASFPLSPDRRHVAPGPLTDFLLQQAAEAYTGLLPGLSPGPELLSLVPGLVGRGELDARLASAIVARLPDTAFLPAADGGSERVRPRDAVLLESELPGLAEWLAPVLPNLVTGPVRHPAWAVLGVRRLSLAELADQLAALDREPAWWRGLYAVLDGGSPQERAELGALPVPLADGRQARGARGLLLASPSLAGPGLADPERLAVLGLRIAHPDAAHPLLARLGAVESTPRGALQDPATQAAVAASYDRAAEAYYDDDSPRRVADTVLGLVAATGAEPGEYPWLADLALPGDDGDWYPAGELLLPDSPLAGVVAGDAPFGTVSPDLVAKHGAETLAAAGVAASFVLVTEEDVPLDEASSESELDGFADWVTDVRDRLRAADADELSLPPVAVQVLGVRDLDLVARDRWPQALDLLSRLPLRAALTEPTRVRLPDGRHADVPSYTAWWLRRHATIDGQRPSGLRAPGADPLLADLYDEVGPSALTALRDPVLARALGVRSSLADLLAEPGGADDLLNRLADPARTVTRPRLRELWAALASADGVTADAVSPPDRVRAVHGDKIEVVDSDDVLVLDSPDLWPLVESRPLIMLPHPRAARLADLLDVSLASEEIPGVIESAGQRQPVPEVLLDVLPGAPASYVEHDELIVDGVDVPWRYRPGGQPPQTPSNQNQGYVDGELHAATVEGLAHGLAWATGRWAARHLLAALLLSPEETSRVRAEADLDQAWSR